MIRVGIDGRALQGNRTGIGRYVYELCRRLDKEFTETIFFIYTNRHLDLPCVNNRWILRCDTSLWGRILRPVLWTKLRAGFLCKKDNLNFFWGPTTFLPKLSDNVKTVVTVHDINYRIVPQTMKFTHLWAHRLFFKADLLRANARIANSPGTAQKIIEYFSTSVTAIIRPSVDKRFVPKTQTEIKEVLVALRIHKPYLLALGTIEPRKNLPVVLESFLRLKRRGDLEGYVLVMVGAHGWKDKKIIAMAEREPSIIRLGFVCDEYLPYLYGGTEIFVYPSLYEGYGMPVLEALKCGTKVVTTNIPEIREIGGDNRVVYVEPNIESVMTGIMKMKNCKLGETPELPSQTWTDGGETMAKVFASLS